MHESIRDFHILSSYEFKPGHYVAEILSIINSAYGDNAFNE